ncbi:Maf family protein [Aquisalinus flavus]|uniref:Nucleoside triphosphate pyrophosphatase n=1 Tax=Aquisalinus flavus TaxID=1526572 RepID=A0A8J2V4Z6_9PROT|nr:nucleoside triphosphate pyrophosphatase [Aquisalinus flavus]MBD0425600.1 Maf-like protein [Aquisalinus flavus]UNE48781.1 Maf-like protein [Aquisalinus flavus]GGD14756.1 Maf-like protein R00002 [Aquisalinus flavus]
MSRIILASGSWIRAQMLRNAGVPFDIVPSEVDEAAIKRRCLGDGDDLRDIAMRLAEAKALSVSRNHPDAYVIGADQVLGLDGHLYDKPVDMDEARARLREFSGRKHTLYSAACIARGQTILWQVIDYPTLTMCTLSDDTIDRYLAEAGEEILSSVGAYQLESIGARLFHQVHGNYFSILGLPLLPLLAFLREQKQLEY